MIMLQNTMSTVGVLQFFVPKTISRTFHGEQIKIHRSSCRNHRDRYRFYRTVYYRAMG